MKISKLMALIGLAFTFVIVGYIYFFWNSIFPCANTLAIVIISISALSIFPYSIYLFVKAIKPYYDAFGYAALATLILLVASLRKEKAFTQDAIDKNGGIIKMAIINHKWSSAKTPETIYVDYIVEGNYKQAQFTCGKDNYKMLSVGDTIFLVYALECPDLTLPFNYFPTSKELYQCKEGCLVKDGKIITPTPAPTGRRLSDSDPMTYY